MEPIAEEAAMSQMTFTVLDADRAIHGRRHASFLDVLIPALSDDPDAARDSALGGLEECGTTGQLQTHRRADCRYNQFDGRRISVGRSRPSEVVHD
jgi:hypothetical protein